MKLYFANSSLILHFGMSVHIHASNGGTCDSAGYKGSGGLDDNKDPARYSIGNNRADPFGIFSVSIVGALWRSCFHLISPPFLVCLGNLHHLSNDGAHGSSIVRAGTTTFRVVFFSLVGQGATAPPQPTKAAHHLQSWFEGGDEE